MKILSLNFLFKKICFTYFITFFQNLQRKFSLSLSLIIHHWMYVDFFTVHWKTKSLQCSKKCSLIYKTIKSTGRKFQKLTIRFSALFFYSKIGQLTNIPDFAYFMKMTKSITINLIFIIFLVAQARSSTQVLTETSPSPSATRRCASSSPTSTPGSRQAGNRTLLIIWLVIKLFS